VTQWELVRVDHHQFALGEPGADTLNAVAEGTLIEVGPGFVSFYTGITYGPARLALDLLEHAPDTEATQEWEVIEEATITTTSDIVVTTLDGTESTTLTPIPAGRYVVRAHTRGRDTRYGEDVTGMAHIDWLRDVLTDMDAGNPVNDDFIANFAARNRLDQDPRITRRIVSGLPAHRELVQQYEALATYSRSMYTEAEPLESAIEAFWHAAKTYGMDYPELIDAACRDFFDKQ